MREFSDQYLKFLTGPLAGINLTRITDPEEFYYKQIVDSVKPTEESATFYQKLNECKLLVDIGFGGGFPILPLASKVPRGTFLGFEARKKKATAVTKIAEHLNLKNVKLYHERLENILIDKDCIITLKAVGKIADFIKLINTTANVNVYFYKGPNWKELEDIGSIGPHWKMIESIDVKIPHTEGRTLVGFSNENVPCGTYKNKKLVKLSEFI